MTDHTPSDREATRDREPPAARPEAGEAAPSGADAEDRRRPAGGAARSRGADLARAALEAARARNAAARAGARAATFGRAAARQGRGLPGQRGRATVAGRMARRRWSGPGPDPARDPQRLGDTVTSWLARTGAAGEVARARVFARWAEIVGPGIAEHAVPVSLVDGELVLQAESTAWATQLRMLAAGIVQRINAEIGRNTVTRIRAKGPSGPSWRFGNRHVSGRGPRDTYG